MTEDVHYRDGLKSLNLEAISSLLECLVCKEIVKTIPIYQCQSNSHSSVFCKKCYAKMTQCPLCNQVLGDFRNRFAESLIDELPKACKNVERGCNIELCTEALKDHENECKYKVILCINRKKGCLFQAHSDVELENHYANQCLFSLMKCAHDSCPNYVLRKNFEKHKTKCEYRLLACIHTANGCYEKFFVKQLNKHEDICTYALVKCKHTNCNKFVPKNSLTQHQDDCEYKKESCRDCDKLIPLILLRQHRLEECEHRMIECSFCGDYSKAGNMVEHKSTCSSRLIKCWWYYSSNEKCNEMIPLSDYNSHLDECHDSKLHFMMRFLTRTEFSMNLKTKDNNKLISRIYTLSVVVSINHFQIYITTFYSEKNGFIF